MKSMKKNILLIHIIILFAVASVCICINGELTGGISAQFDNASENNQDSTKDERVQTVFGSGFDLASCEQITEKDVYELCTRIREKDIEEFEAITMVNRFHQHIDPNNIYGAKMALYAKKLLNGTDNEIRVLSEAGTKQPVSCLNDGIMVAIGATFGRGLIENAPGPNKLAATFFYKDESVRLEIKSERLDVTQRFIADSLKRHKGLNEDYFKDVRAMGLYVWENFSQEDLFIVSYPESEEGYYCDFNDNNIYVYINRLHNFFHTAPADEEILDFIEQDKCVYNGSIITDDSVITIVSTWKSNNETILFEHIT
ncbi:MAG: formylmethanofuran dehydrogenase subunit E family protein, partial [archaeon]|nr:formylmethanofuran dehydrogenase subunit E family protein [archaeon]